MRCGEEEKREKEKGKKKGKGKIPPLNPGAVDDALVDLLFRTKDNIRQVLTSVYPLNPGAVDDALVDLLYGPSEDAGALETFCSILSGPPGPRPEQLLPQLGERPCLVLWGTNDVFTPSDGPIGRWFRALPSTSPNVEFIDLPGLGHCPHDEAPEAVHEHLLPFLERVTIRAEAVAA